MLGTGPVQVLGVPQPLSSALMLPAPASPPPFSRLMGPCTDPPSCKCTQGWEEAVTPEAAPRLCSTRPQSPRGKERSCIFTGHADDVTVLFSPGCK